MSRTILIMGGTGDLGLALAEAMWQAGDRSYKSKFKDILTD